MHPGTFIEDRAAQLDRAAPRETVFTSNGESIFYRGHYKGPFESRLLLNHLRRPLPADDWFTAHARQLADELEQAMREAGYIPEETA